MCSETKSPPFALYFFFPLGSGANSQRCHYPDFGVAYKMAAISSIGIHPSWKKDESWIKKFISIHGREATQWRSELKAKVYLSLITVETT